MDCRTCRAAQARYCADCVQELATERQRGLAEYKSENRRLAHIMAKGLEDLARVRSRADAQREHAELVEQLTAKLSTVRSEADRLAVSVNELRHAVRRTSARFARTKAGVAAAGTGSAVLAARNMAGGGGPAADAECAGASGAGASAAAAQEEAEQLRMRLSDRRRQLLCELLAWVLPAEASAAPWGDPGEKAPSDGVFDAGGGPPQKGRPSNPPPLVLFQHLMLPPAPPPLGQSAATGLRCAPLSALLGHSVPQGIPEAESQVRLVSEVGTRWVGGGP
eukprot:scaffold33470_cov124-Isochrysis_galbana.AAC.1